LKELNPVSRIRHIHSERGRDGRKKHRFSGRGGTKNQGNALTQKFCACFTGVLGSKRREKFQTHQTEGGEKISCQSNARVCKQFPVITPQMVYIELPRPTRKEKRGGRFNRGKKKGVDRGGSSKKKLNADESCQTPKTHRNCQTKELKEEKTQRGQTEKFKRNGRIIGRYFCSPGEQ